MGEKSLLDAYILGIPFGLFGAHNFYLGRKGFGILYVCTLGVFGLGYIFDLCRMKWLVRHVNLYGTGRKMVSDCYLICLLGGLFGAHHFYLGNKKLGLFYVFTLGVFLVGWIIDLIRMKYLVQDHNDRNKEKSVGTAYILGLSPFGPFGAYHYYLGNIRLGLVYTFTVGIFGIGWIVDLFRMPKLVKKAGLGTKSVGTAYIMAMPPFGLFGAHHYYLGNYALGATYTWSLGIFTVGWIVDLFRMKGLVKAANDPTSDYGTTKITAYILCVSPLGLFGVHHFYLKRYLNGGFYIGTFGLFGVGWIFDMFRLPVLYERYAGEDKHKYPDEAYMYWFPFGLFGLHQFYLGRKKWGILYACTFGCLTIGWIIDAFRLPSLIRRFNKTVQDPDMNNFRICKPKCSTYRCKRCCTKLVSCSCCDSSYLTSNSSKSDAEKNAVSANVTTRNDFDVIKEMYPGENHEQYIASTSEDTNAITVPETCAVDAGQRPAYLVDEYGASKEQRYHCPNDTQDGDTFPPLYDQLDHGKELGTRDYDCANEYADCENTPQSWIQSQFHKQSSDDGDDEIRHPADVSVNIENDSNQYLQ